MTTITLPGIRALSRNQTTGHFINYVTQLTKAEDWMSLFGRRYEHHYDVPVVVTIDAYFDTRLRSAYIDAPNIDDKIFTDILIRYKSKRVRTGPVKSGKTYTSIRIERSVWFLEDDSPKYLAEVRKRSWPGNEDKVVITIEPVTTSA